MHNMGEYWRLWCSVGAQPCALAMNTIWVRLNDCKHIISFVCNLHTQNTTIVFGWTYKYSSSQTTKFNFLDFAAILKCSIWDAEIRDIHSPDIVPPLCGPLPFHGPYSTLYSAKCMLSIIYYDFYGWYWERRRGIKVVGAGGLEDWGNEGVVLDEKGIVHYNYV